MVEEFGTEPQVYLGLAVPKFPNYFIMNGPRANWANGSVLPSVSFSEQVFNGPVLTFSSAIA